MPTEYTFDYETLEELYVEKGLPGYKVAEELGVDAKTAIRHLRKHGLYEK